MEWMLQCFTPRNKDPGDLKVSRGLDKCPGDLKVSRGIDKCPRADQIFVKLNKSNFEVKQIREVHSMRVDWVLYTYYFFI